MHTKARGPDYPGTSVKKCQVPNEFVKWTVAYEDYKPVEYTSDIVLKKPVWADPDIRYKYSKLCCISQSIQWTNRHAERGQYYKDIGRCLINPFACHFKIHHTMCYSILYVFW